VQILYRIVLRPAYGMRIVKLLRIGVHSLTFRYWLKRLWTAKHTRSLQRIHSDPSQRLL